MENNLFAELSAALTKHGFIEELRQGPELSKGQYLAFARVPRAKAFQYWRELKEVLADYGFYPLLAQDETELYEIVDGAWSSPIEEFDAEVELSLFAKTLKQPVELVKAKYGHLLEKAGIEKASLKAGASFEEIVAAGSRLTLGRWFACSAREHELVSLVKEFSIDDDNLAQDKNEARASSRCSASQGTSGKGKHTLDLLKPDHASDPSFDSGLAGLGLTPDLLDLLMPSVPQDSSFEDPYLITSISNKISENPVRLTGKCVIVFLPLASGYEVPAFFGFGLENSCPPPVVQVAVLKHWFEKYGAELAVLSHDGLELVLKQAPPAKALARLAREQFLYCPQLFELLNSLPESSRDLYTSAESKFTEFLSSESEEKNVGNNTAGAWDVDNDKDKDKDKDPERDENDPRLLKMAALEQSLEGSLVWSFYWV
jgi:hypothetical protein